MDARARLPEEWAERLGELGQPRFRAKQLFSWVHAHGVDAPERMSNLPKALRASLATDFDAGSLREVELHPSSDGTRKITLRCADEAVVETVLLPAEAADPTSLEELRARGATHSRASARAQGLVEESIPVTQCVSSQVGCAMGCVFCASGQRGLLRHLSASEIVQQVLIARQHLLPGEALRGLVFMGMGEPLHNYDALARAIRVLTHKEGLGLAQKRITVSTSGLVPAIDRFAEDFEGKVRLAVSLHAATDALRETLVPVNRKYDLATLMASLKRYPLRPTDRITFEYTLIDKVNDGLDEAKRLADYVAQVPCMVNLIPMNPIDADPTIALPTGDRRKLGMPSSNRCHAFQRVLRECGVPTYLRKQRGDDVAAACGQLAFKAEDLLKNRRGRAT